MLLALVALILGSGGTPATKPALPCAGTLLLSIPLASREAFRVEAPGGLIVLGESSGGVWNVSVFSASATPPAPDLLAQPGSPEGSNPVRVSALAYRDRPNDWVIPIRSTPHSLCLRFLKVRLAGSGARSVFKGGVLEVRLLTASVA